jgi:antitoxin HigA-1
MTTSLKPEQEHTGEQKPQGDRMARQTMARHPGTVLREDFLIPRGLTIYRVTQDTGLDRWQTCRLLCGHRRIDPQEAATLSAYLDLEQDHLQTVQDCYDLLIRAGL